MRLYELQINFVIVEFLIVLSSGLGSAIVFPAVPFLIWELIKWDACALCSQLPLTCATGKLVWFLTVVLLSDSYWTDISQQPLSQLFQLIEVCIQVACEEPSVEDVQTKGFVFTQ